MTAMLVCGVVVLRGLGRHGGIVALKNRRGSSFICPMPIFVELASPSMRTLV